MMEQVGESGSLHTISHLEGCAPPVSKLRNFRYQGGQEGIVQRDGKIYEKSVSWRGPTAWPSKGEITCICFMEAF